jgi:hypothetical protein
MGLNYWFTTGCLTTEDAVGTTKPDVTRIKLVLKQLIPLAVGFAVLACAYVLIPAGICSILEINTVTSSGYARLSFIVSNPAVGMIGDLMADVIIPVVIILYTIGISMVLRLVFRKSKLIRA